MLGMRSEDLIDRGGPNVRHMKESPDRSRRIECLVMATSR